MGGTRAIIAAAIAAAAIVTAAPAAADNQTYLAAVAPIAGRFDNNTERLLLAGKTACGMLAPDNYMMFGHNPTEVANRVWRIYPTLERPDAVLIVNTAIDHLCPGTNPFGLYAA